jgi:2-oxoglutarate dehydrogenase E2 component (dihydrolipoamide succinyltransferase)
VLAEIVVADGGTVVAEQLIARIDTEGKGGAAAPAPVAPASLQRRRLLPQRRPAATAQGKGVAMPAAAKLMADNNLAPVRWPAPARTAA